MTHGPFTIDHWWDSARGAYRCNLVLGRIQVSTVDTSVYGSPVGAELLAWREMAERLAGQLGEFQVPVPPPQSFGLSH